MREQRRAQVRPIGQIESRGQILPVMSGESDAFGSHDGPSAFRALVMTIPTMAMPPPCRKRDMSAFTRR
jgi:hypothetical protein